MNIMPIKSQNVHNAINHKGKLPPMHKPPLEYTTPNLPEHIEDGHLWGWVGGIIALGTAFFALLKGHKAKNNLKGKNQVLAEEQNLVTDKIAKLKQELDRLQNLQQNKEQEIEQIKQELNAVEISTQSQNKHIKPSHSEDLNQNYKVSGTQGQKSSNTEKTSLKNTTSREIRKESSDKATNTMTNSLTEDSAFNLEDGFSSLSAEEFEEKMRNFQSNYKKEMDKLQEQMVELKDIKDATDISKLLEHINNIRGFERIQGYKKVKDFMKEKLGNTNGNSPNIILLYGPQGTGKTLFAQEVSYETNTNHIKFALSMNQKQNLANFKNIVNTSKETFENTGKRTIIQIDEIDAIFPKDQIADKEFLSIINNLDKTYHATIIATTNNPEHLSNNFLNSKNFEKLYLPPADKSEIAQILKFVSQYIADSNVNYEQIADFIVHKADGNAYSNARIYSAIKKVVKNHKDISKKVQQHEFLDALNKELGSPDITKESLDKYNKLKADTIVQEKTNNNPFTRYDNISNLSADEFEKTMADFQQDYKQQMHILEEGAKSIQETKNRTDISKLLTELENVKGFARIQGANKTKDFFYKNVILPARSNNQELIPNTVLLYGPQGTGKTLFAKELANEGGFNYAYFKIPRNEEKVLAELQDIVNNSKEEYINTNKRTIIQIDEIDTLLFENPKVSKEISAIINNLSNEYHSTLIATTNNPEIIDKTLISTAKFKSLYMPPASKTEIVAILKYIGQYIAEDNVDYEKLAQKILSKAGNAAFSNARIYKFIKDVAKENNNIAKKLTQQEIERAIDNKLINPDIEASVINSYKNILF